mmetsp:Transcript_21145/g.38271  ORF Transcript_21145/g.38271 Transcript_21145/m.38271 type:complete len:545 (-) Transcript_21145:272-1906(-)|eukprot:CAMPEP_0201872886 /NCGR_PEP_ID=MMETSP0902-20130614/5501_1 /ASSEMBLY_ACC=CAM_ASM_000551 /TAXON_ID=420261 /ORGANISM="Thalassiosira antarctica, Strain CCMP982" /LENGTH=544 /DNA_ID=CAMNT_0048399311 /DNA_START=238 /DNA_END=1872 /DNA_ORIENTATION=+
MSSQRVTRSFRHRDMGTIEADTAPSFSVGMSSTNESPAPRPRSTRRAAGRASNRIAEEAAPQRRSTRVAARKDEAARKEEAARSVSAAERTRGLGRGAPSPASRGSKETPIVLDDEEIGEMNLKPAAKAVAGGVAVASSASSAAQKPPADFTCAICIDAPSSMAEVASISGCTHRFCFDCIDKWAQTENKCPCCKARFQTIDRVVALPPSPASPARRGKRKRSATAASSGSNTRARRGGSASTAAASGGASPARNRRVNSRNVEERNQQSLSAFPINAAIVEQILASFTSFGGPLRGTGQVTFGTSADGRPAIRMIRPASGGMVGVMEMFLPDDLASGGNGPAAAARGGGAAGGSGSSPTRTARVRFARAPAGSGSRRGSSGSGVARSSSSFPPGAGLPPPLALRLMETSSEIAASVEGGTRGSAGVARASGAASARPASASSRAGGSRAARQGASTFASLFASLGSASMSSPRSRTRAGGGAAAAAGSAGGAGGSSNGLPNRMTIRIIARERRTSGGSNGGNGASGSGNNESGGSNDEPIIID